MVVHFARVPSALRWPPRIARVARVAVRRCVSSIGSSSGASNAPVGMESAAFRYELPDELIAQHAADPRDAARLLVQLPPDEGASGGASATHGQLHDATFADLPRLLPPSAHLVFNESRVFAARMHARPRSATEADAAVEVMFLSPDADAIDASHALGEAAHGQIWRAMVRLPLETVGLELQATPAVGHRLGEEMGRLGHGLSLSLHVERVVSVWTEEDEDPGVEAAVRVQVDAPSADGASADGAADQSPLLLRDAFGAFGAPPLPPYIRREAAADDVSRYQAVYASESRVGSVAAPTAGLHFTEEMLARLEAIGVRSSRLALHVGAGTFRPISSSYIAEHDMHAERFSMHTDEIEAIAASIEQGRPIVPVGTTSTRVLESLYWLGVRQPPAGDLGLDLGGDLDLGHLEQWEAYRPQDDSACAASMASCTAGATAKAAAELAAQPTVDAAAAPAAPAALRALCRAARDRGCSAVSGSTSLCIAPGYAFQVTDALITNFHAPDSSLMLLVSALRGSTASLHAAYAHAIAQRYRFLSYGDACLLFHTSAARTAGAKLAAEVGAAVGEAGRGEATATLTKGGGYTKGAALPEHLGSHGGRRVLLHSCCAPCSGAMVEAMVEAGHDVTIFFYNPNIHPRKEYMIRKEENKRYAETLGIDFVDLDGDVDEWYKRAKGMEFCPERGARCSMCFDMRLERTALYAHEHGFDSFTTTNATSRWKDEAQVNASGLKAATKYEGVEYWLSNWQTAEMTQRKYRINADEAFYKQEYCGCSFSLRDSNHFRAKEGLPPLVIGGGGVYHDPEVDEQEESIEVVEGFFSQSEQFEAEIKATYEKRRKTKEEENW